MRYQEHGLVGVQSSPINNRYSKDFKLSVVKEHLEEDATIKGLARKYNIPSHTTVRNWMIKYTKGKDCRIYSGKSEVHTMTGRKTTYEEKVKIVKDCLGNDLSYKEAAE